jgi:ornithine cyclodeaminase/alanine dehydrogenase-like protein (mu-crystallin family)
MHAAGGGFHIKAGFLDAGRSFFAAKLNANFPENAARFQMPTIQGAVVLCDADNGFPLAIMDSIEITSRRTAAATAVAAKHLARPDARVATVCGAGIQGRVQIQALARVRELTEVFVFDKDEARARHLARVLAGDISAEVAPAADLADAVRRSDVCVTCTTARRFFLRKEMVPPGAFVAAVGADNPDKQEIDPELLASATLVVDLLDQCAAIGDLHHALTAGVMATTDVHAELGEVVAGKKRGRTSRDEITVFDSTGMALQDVAAAAAVYTSACAARRGHRVVLGDLA